MQFLYQNTSRALEPDMGQTAGQLAPYINHLQKVASNGGYNDNEGSINLPFDQELAEEMLKTKKAKVNRQLKYIINIGIGGSNLGAKAIYDALYGYFDVVELERFPKMVFADTNDPKFLARLQKFLRQNIGNPSEILVNVVSKSGQTTETMVNLEILEQVLPQAKDRLVITTSLDSSLAQTAKDRGITHLTIPAQVGGRFSVFSAAGLFPLSTVDIDIENLLQGARLMRKRCLNQNIPDNPAALSAITIHLNLKNGKTIHNNFFFHPELESVGKWCRQLMAESLGKQKDLGDNVINAGITPIVSIGSTDLHSMLQLYLAGPKDKFTTFIRSGRNRNDLKIPLALPLTGSAQNLARKTAGQVMDAILKAVKKTYQKSSLPFSEIVLPDISANSLGQFMQFKMIETMYLGKLLNVNAFNQPAVEGYKLETDQILSKM